MNYAGIKYPDVCNGPGCRVSLFVSGCRLNCPGCFNKNEQSFSWGQKYTEETKEEILNKVSLPWISGLSVLGGDPLEEENQKDVLELIVEVKKRFPDKETWLWTGRTIEDLRNTEQMKEILKHVDVLIDGHFIMELKDLTLEWRGSSNQRIIREPYTVFKEVHSIEGY